MRQTALAAAVIVGVAVVTLGTDWTGTEVAPGVWRDRVSLARWVTFYGLLVTLGIAGGRWLPTWTQRLLALLPTLAWMTWQLQAGTLWPIALALYGTGSVLAWSAGCALANLRHAPGRP